MKQIVDKSYGFYIAAAANCGCSRFPSSFTQTTSFAEITQIKQITYNYINNTNNGK